SGRLARCRRQRSVKLLLECLEDRTLPSGLADTFTTEFAHIKQFLSNAMDTAGSLPLVGQQLKDSLPKLETQVQDFFVKQLNGWSPPKPGPVTDQFLLHQTLKKDFNFDIGLGGSFLSLQTSATIHTSISFDYLLGFSYDPGSGKFDLDFHTKLSD